MTFWDSFWAVPVGLFSPFLVGALVFGLGVICLINGVMSWTYRERWYAIVPWFVGFVAVTWVFAALCVFIGSNGIEPLSWTPHP